MPEAAYKRPTRNEVENLRRLNEAQSRALLKVKGRVARLEAALMEVQRSIEASMGDDAEPWVTYIEDALKGQLIEGVEQVLADWNVVPDEKDLTDAD